MITSKFSGFVDSIRFYQYTGKIASCKEKNKKEVVEKLYKAIENVNKVLNLKVPIGIDYNVGLNYSEVH